MFSFFSKKILIYVGIGLAVIIAIIIKFSDGNGKQTAVIVWADIVQEVAATGKAKPNQSVNLGFDKSGRVGNVYADVGESVKGGQIIATLESAEISADLAKAEALLQEKNIKLREIKSTAPITYNDASKNLDATVKEGFADADNAIRNKTDQFFKTPATNPQFEISITSGNFIHYFNVPNDIRMEINNERKKVEEILTDWQKGTLNISSSNLVSEADKAIANLNAISLFLDKMAGAVNTFTSADYAYDTAVSNYKVAISGARSDVSGAISAIVTAKDKFNSAPTLGEAGQFENVLTQEAVVSQAEATVASLKASLSKSAIRAPFDGVVTLQDAKVGGAVSAGATLVSIISQNKMYIEADISEIHIGKIAVANPVSVTFDAFQAEEFSGQISFIEPGDVIIDGIVNYKIRVSLANADPRIKSGLTANLKIQTAKKENVLAVPLYAVFEENGQNFVNKIVGKNTQKIPVTLGLSGNNGLAEILSGLAAGDKLEF
ncbi:MAG: efflux RND transporter periplasmic adaptor subunit [Patescibacteria group bacterium]